jgi:ABC-type oligopeptide transport system ATPase subunit
MTIRREREVRVSQWLRVVGLKQEQMRRYPHQFCGRRHRRIGVARALALNFTVICGRIVIDTQSVLFYTVKYLRT